MRRSSTLASGAELQQALTLALAEQVGNSAGPTSGAVHCGTDAAPGKQQQQGHRPSACGTSVTNSVQSGWQWRGNSWMDCEPSSALNNNSSHRFYRVSSTVLAGSSEVLTTSSELCLSGSAVQLGFHVPTHMSSYDSNNSNTGNNNSNHASSSGARSPFAASTQTAIGGSCHGPWPSPPPEAHTQPQRSSTTPQPSSAVSLLSVQLQKQVSSPAPLPRANFYAPTPRGSFHGVRARAVAAYGASGLRPAATTSNTIMSGTRYAGVRLACQGAGAGSGLDTYGAATTAAHVCARVVVADPRLPPQPTIHTVRCMGNQE